MIHSVNIRAWQGRPEQGCIYRDVSYLERFTQQGGQVSVSQVLFPYVYVLTQDCDLEWDHESRAAKKDIHDKYLVSVMVAPIYNGEHLRYGTHLDQLGLTPDTPDDGPKMKMTDLGNRAWNLVQTNQNERYHTMAFPDGIPVPERGVIDFKHYFTVPVFALSTQKPICVVSELDRAHVSHRFASYLARVGLPEVGEPEAK